MTVRVKNLAALNRAFDKAGKDTKREIREAFKDAAEPVRADAQVLAADKIRNVREGDRWAGMRVGVTQSLVYVAPKARRNRANDSLKRPNFAGLLLNEAMLAALEKNEDKIERAAGDVLDKVVRDWGSGG